MEIEGKLIMDLPEEGGTSKAGNLWRKKSWVIETFGQFPRKVCFNAFGDRINALNLELGKSYKVSVDIESREFNGRWYTDVRAYACSEIGDPMSAAPAQPLQPIQQAPTASPFGTPAMQAPAADPFASGSDTDDLPF